MSCIDSELCVLILLKPKRFPHSAEQCILVHLDNTVALLNAADPQHVHNGAITCDVLGCQLQ